MIQSRRVHHLVVLVIVLPALCFGACTAEFLNMMNSEILQNFSDVNMMSKVDPISTQGDVNRIFDGKTVRWEAAPFMVGIRATRQGINACGGTLLTSRLVLTAAHCVTRYVWNKDGEYVGHVPRKGQYVSIGTNLRSGADSGEQIEVSKVKVHRLFSRKSLSSMPTFDAGILVLRHSVSAQYHHFVEYDTIRNNPEERPRWLGSQTDAYGWGAIQSTWQGSAKPMYYTYPDLLQHTRLKFQPKKSCQSWFDNAVHFEYFCAGSGLGKHQQKPQKGICKGDSGGPLMYGGRQIGIASGTDNMCGVAPAVFLRVSDVHSWIDHVIREDAKRQQFLSR